MKHLKKFNEISTGLAYRAHHNTVYHDKENDNDPIMKMKIKGISLCVLIKQIDYLKLLISYTIYKKMKILQLHKLKKKIYSFYQLLK